MKKLIILLFVTFLSMISIKAESFNSRLENSCNYYWTPPFDPNPNIIRALKKKGYRLIDINQRFKGTPFRYVLRIDPLTNSKYGHIEFGKVSAKVSLRLSFKDRTLKKQVPLISTTITKKIWNLRGPHAKASDKLYSKVFESIISKIENDLSFCRGDSSVYSEEESSFHLNGSFTEVHHYQEDEGMDADFVPTRKIAFKGNNSFEYDIYFPTLECKVVYEGQIKKNHLSNTFHFILDDILESSCDENEIDLIDSQRNKVLYSFSNLSNLGTKIPTYDLDTDLGITFE